MKNKATGLVYIFTGNGKGKTSAALGVAMRAVGQGRRVVMVQWYKEKAKGKKQKAKLSMWQIGEHQIPELLKEPLFEIHPMGRGFYKLPTDHATPVQHRKSAQVALKLAGKLLAFDQQLFLLILDEALNAVNDKLIDLVDLVNLISKRGQTHMILTGRDAPKKLIGMADLVTEMKNVKHPYDSGKKAVMGLDY